MIVPREGEKVILGTLFNPPFWMGNEPPPPVLDEVSMDRLRRNPFKTVQYGARQLLLFRMGMLVLNEEGRDSALVGLNSLLACWGLFLDATSVQDCVIEVVARRDNGQILSFGYNLASAAGYTLKAGKPFLLYGLRLPDESLDRLMLFANQVAADDSLLTLLRLRLDAHTLMRHRFLGASLVLHWSIIEACMGDMFKEYLKQEISPGKVRRNKEKRSSMVEGSRWTAAHVIETLELTGQISRDDYERYYKIRSIRNKLLHDRRDVSLDDCLLAEGCTRKLLFSRAGAAKVGKIDFKDVIPQRG